MCGKRLKVFLLLLGLSLLSPFVPLYSYSYADVILTDEEAQELMEQIQVSKTELQTVRENLQSAQTELEDVKNTSIEQKIYYEEQLNEAEKKSQTLETCLTVTSTTTVVFALLLVLLFVF